MIVGLVLFYWQQTHIHARRPVPRPRRLIGGPTGGAAFRGLAGRQGVRGVFGPSRTSGSPPVAAR
jgi:hypothetical protein